MMAPALLLAAAQTLLAATMSLDDRCQIADAILQAKGTQAADMKVLHLRLIDEPSIEKKTKRQDKTILRGFFHRKQRIEDLFASGDRCSQQAFLLDPEDPAPVGPRDPTGNDDLVIEIHLWPAGANKYRFTEQLGLSKHTYCSDRVGPRCGIAVPPARLSGVVQKKEGSWSATVTKSLFAF